MPSTAKVVGSDASTDLAVLKVDPKDVKGGLKPLELGESKALKVGRADRSRSARPFGLSGTLTTRHRLGARARDRVAQRLPASPAWSRPTRRSTPATRAARCSNGSGQVIGVNSQIASSGAASNSGVGFAVPVDTVKRGRAAAQERQGDRARLPRRRARARRQDGTGRRRRARPRRPVGRRRACATGDKIVSVGGKQISTPEEHRRGDRRQASRAQNVQIDVTRGGDRKTVNVKLGTRPESGAADERSADPDGSGRTRRRPACSRRGTEPRRSRAAHAARDARSSRSSA